MRIAALASAVLFAFSGEMNAAECDIKHFDQNGIYYSASGDPREAVRIRLEPMPGVNQSSSLALVGRPTQKYNAQGHFFIRSDVADEPWFNLPTTLKGEALLVRRQSRSVDKLSPKFVSVFRDTLENGICPSAGEQLGYARERNFVDQGAFIQYHQQTAGERNHAELRDRFHFQYDDGGYSCVRTDQISDDEGKPIAGMVYNGDIFDVQPAGRRAIEQTGRAIASIVLPRPAYADPAERIKLREKDASLNIAGIEASLHHISGNQGACISWPAPVPTHLAGGFWANVFGLRASHEKAAIRMAETGNWSPRITEVFVFKVSEKRPAGLIRLEWRK